MSVPRDGDQLGASLAVDQPLVAQVAAVMLHQVGGEQHRGVGSATARNTGPDGDHPGNDTWIAKCLPRREQETGANRAGKVYNLKRMKEKRAVLDCVAELRRIVGKHPVKADDPKLRLAA